MSGKLLPCPFCGGKAKLQDFDFSQGRMWLVGCADNTCSVSCDVSKLYQTKERAIKAWNRRAERTCSMEYNEEWSGDELYPTSCYVCSECSHMTNDGIPNYCPNCGAKVADE